MIPLRDSKKLPSITTNAIVLMQVPYQCVAMAMSRARPMIIQLRRSLYKARNDSQCVIHGPAI